LVVVAFPKEFAERMQPRVEVEEKADSGPGVPVVDIINIEQHVKDAAPPPGRIEPQLRATLDMIPAYAWYANPSGGLTFVNQRQADYLGLPKDHPLRLGVDMAVEWDSHIVLLHPDDHEEARRVWATCLRTGSPGQMSFRVRNAEGRYRWFLTRAEPVRASDGTLLYWIGVNLDIEDRKQAEFYLAQGQRLAHMGGWSFKPDLTCDYWSRELYEILGFDPKCGIPTISDYFTRVHPQDREMVEATIQRMIRAGEGCDLKKRIIRRDGVQRVIRCVGMPVQENGMVTRFVGTLMDITEQEEMTQELRRREAYLSEAQRLSHTGSFGWKPDSGEIIWSAETYRIFEYDRAVTPIIDLVVQRAHPEDRVDVQSVIERASRGASDFEHAYRLLLPDGRVKHVHALAHVTQDAFGNREFVGAVTDITEQRRAEESLRESESYLAEAQKLSHTGSWAWSPDTDVRYWSEECYRVLGFDPRDGLPRFEEFIQRIHPDDQPAFRESAKRATHNKLDEEVDYRIVHPGGAVRDIHSVGHPVFSPCGDLIEYTGTVIDITERKRVEEALRTSERKYRSLVDTIPAFVHTALPNGDLDFFNRGWLEYLGLPITDLLGWRWTSAIHPEDIEELVAKWRAGLESGEAFVAEARVRRADGEYRWFLHRKQPQRNEAGQIVKWYGSSIEIEERKIAEKAIRRSEAYLAEAQRLSHTGSSAHDPTTGKIRYWSEETYRIWGLDPQQPLPDRSMLLKMIHPEDRDLVYERYLNAVREGRDYDQECRIVQPGGSVRHFHVVGHPVFSAGGELVDYVSTFMDITERKSAEEALQLIWRDLQEGKARLEEAQRITHVGYWERDLATSRITWSDETYRIYGLQPQEHPMDLKALRQKVHPEDWEFVSRALNEAIAGGPRYDMEFRILRPTGEFRIVHSQGDLKRDSSGQPYQMFGTVQDITDRKRAEEAMRLSEAFLAEGQRLSHTGSWGWNASTGKLTWSQEHFRILGLDPQDTNPSLDLFWERVHPDDKIGLRRAFESAIREKRDFEQEFRIVTPDWAIRHLHGVGHAILNKANELVEFIGSTIDITERKRAEERAQSQREGIQLALNAFVEELDVDRFLGDMITELNKQFHANTWELWLFDEALNEFFLHLSSHSGNTRSRGTHGRTTRRLEDLACFWQSKSTARVPQVFDLPAQGPRLGSHHCESLTAQGIKTLLIVPLALGEQNLGLLELHFQSSRLFPSGDLELAQALVNHATLALQLNRLARRAGQLAVTEERNRLARDIHDTLAQAFAGIVLHSEALGTSLAVSKRRSVKSLSQIRKLARSGLDEARRSVQALRPKALEDGTLSEALKHAANRLSEGGMLSCRFRQRGETQMLSPESQNELFRIAQEALTNVKKHAQATSVSINLTYSSRQVSLAIRDNGVGLTAATSAEPKQGYGLGTMRERALRIGGQLEIKNHESGGACVRVRVPLMTTDKSIILNQHP
jgi:PAS domain S-box-containing protein